MEEPSVLDYLKSKLNPFSSEKLELPVQSEPLEETDQPLSRIDDSSEQPTLKKIFFSLPWRPLLAVSFALTAQIFLEPPSPQPARAVAFYFFALLFLAWSVRHGEWLAPDLRPSDIGEDPGTFRRNPFIAACVVGLVAFVFLGDNRFTIFNTSLWVLSIALFVYSLWLPKYTLRERWLQVQGFFKRDSWSVKITPWLLLLVFIWGVAIFYRFSDLNNVPAEPFSDHVEKLLDVYDVSQGQTKIFFERNTGREFVQMYLTLAVATLFGTGLSFLSLKLTTALAGFLTLPYIYLLGKELFNKRVGMFALAFTAIAYWPNVISRVGLRFPFYPLFAAPAIYYLVRGLRTQNRNDFILSGLFLGLGLHGYSSFRFLPVFVVIVLLLYVLHSLRNVEIRQQATVFAAVLVLASTFAFLPLLRYSLEHPGMVAYRAMTRLSDIEQPLPAEPLSIFFDNLKNSMLMFNLNNGQIWVHSIVKRPALDVISAAFFVFGFFLLLARYYRQRDWRYLFLLLSVPFLLMPSVLSLAFPGENPSLNRSGGAYITVFIIVAFAMDALYNGLKQVGWRKAAVALVVLLMSGSAVLNYDLVFNKYANQFRYSIWNTSDIANITSSFASAGNSIHNAWVIAYPYWIDTRLVGVMLADPLYDPALWPDQIGDTFSAPGNKIFFVKQDDFESIALLRAVYPDGALSYYRAAPDLVDKDFWVFSAPEAFDIFDLNTSQP